MSDIFHNPNIDPFNNDAIVEYYNVQSLYYLPVNGFDDIILPALNFPYDTPTRLFYSMPFIPDLSDLGGSKPFELYNITDAVLLTKVTTITGNNQYRIAPADSKRPQIVEFSANLATKEIGFDYWTGKGSTIEAEEMNNIDRYGPVLSKSYLKTQGNYIDVYNAYPLTTILTNYTVYQKIQNLQGWDMQTFASIVFKIFNTNVNNILNISIVIFDDAGKRIIAGFETSSNQLVIDIVQNAADVDMTLTRIAGGFYDNANYNNGAISRGFILFTMKR